MIPQQPAPAQRAAIERRYLAAQRLERAGQIAREAARYGLATRQHKDAVDLAQQEYEAAGAVTEAAGS